MASGLVPQNRSGWPGKTPLRWMGLPPPGFHKGGARKGGGPLVFLTLKLPNGFFRRPIMPAPAGPWPLFSGAKSKTVLFAGALAS